MKVAQLVTLPLLVVDPGTEMGVAIVGPSKYGPGHAAVAVMTVTHGGQSAIRRAIDHGAWAEVVALGMARDVAPLAAVRFLDGTVTARGTLSILSQGMVMGAVAAAVGVGDVDLIPEMEARRRLIGKRSKEAVAAWVVAMGYATQGELTSHEAEVVLGAAWCTPGLTLHVRRVIPGQGNEGLTGEFQSSAPEAP